MTKIVVFDNGEKFSEEEGDLGIFCTVRIRKSSQKKDAIDIRGGVIGKGEDGLVLDALIKNAVSINERRSVRADRLGCLMSDGYKNTPIYIIANLTQKCNRQGLEKS
jgi:hypothetical protein